jgi:hypothetical protein
MIGNNFKKTVTADRSHKEKFTDYYVNNGVQSKYYDVVNINESISESDEHSTENQIRATNQSIIKEDVSPITPDLNSSLAINPNNIVQLTKIDKNTSKNIDKKYSFKANHSGN